MSKTILSIDDSASIRQLVDITLTAAGYTVLQAVDGSDGYAKGTSNHVDAVITDLNMPVMNGIEFIRKFRTHPNGMGTPVIFLTTESDAELKQEARAAGATGWLVKPFVPEQLLAIIKKVAG